MEAVSWSAVSTLLTIGRNSHRLPSTARMPNEPYEASSRSMASSGAFVFGLGGLERSFSSPVTSLAVESSGDGVEAWPPAESTVI